MLNIDPAGESGGLNLYAFVQNDGVNLIDLLGLVFIAVGIRPAKAAAGLQNHMAIEFYEENVYCAKKGYKFKSSDVGKALLQNSKRTDHL